MSKLYVDDIRKAPTGWEQAYTYSEAIYLLNNYNYDKLSLDHDLGFTNKGIEQNGYDILNWLEERQFNSEFIPGDIFAHTANPVGLQRMNVVIERLKIRALTNPDDRGE